MKKTWLPLVPALLLTFFALSGCSDSAAPDAAKAGAPQATPATKTLVIGLDDNFPPMGFVDENGVLVGFDIDMAREAAHRMGREAVFRPIDWSAKEAELMSKRLDLLWNGLTITPARQQKIGFSRPYMENHQIIVVASGSPVKGKADLARKIVGVQDGSSAEDAIARDAATAQSFQELRRYPDNVKALLDLHLGRIDAVVLDEVVGRYYVAKKPADYQVLETDNFGVEEYGVGLRKEDEALRAKLDATLDAMKADGATDAIAYRWFGKAIAQ
ncbi:MAG: amino acid ABC transporter substrate-binding protein [Zoogloeaceae bacterium]|jgi:polar amino acid transport system substrate-binding protein|nr:amino acid ABC transporter substrate-binding protein [Zoogloeaceae bacterium]